MNLKEDKQTMDSEAFFPSRPMHTPQVDISTSFPKFSARSSLKKKENTSSREKEDPKNLINQL